MYVAFLVIFFSCLVTDEDDPLTIFAAKKVKSEGLDSSVLDLKNSTSSTPDDYADENVLDTLNPM